MIRSIDEMLSDPKTLSEVSQNHIDAYLLKLRGFTVSEIASDLSLSQGRIRQILATVEGKYLTYEHWKYGLKSVVKTGLDNLELSGIFFDSVSNLRDAINAGTIKPNMIYDKTLKRKLIINGFNALCLHCGLHDHLNTAASEKEKQISNAITLLESLGYTVVPPKN